MLLYFILENGIEQYMTDDTSGLRAKILNLPQAGSDSRRLWYMANIFFEWLVED